MHLTTLDERSSSTLQIQKKENQPEVVSWRRLVKEMRYGVRV